MLHLWKWWKHVHELIVAVCTIWWRGLKYQVLVWNLWHSLLLASLEAVEPTNVTSGLVLGSIWIKNIGYIWETTLDIWHILKLWYILHALHVVTTIIIAGNSSNIQITKLVSIIRVGLIDMTYMPSHLSNLWWCNQKWILILSVIIGGSSWPTFIAGLIICSIVQQVIKVDVQELFRVICWSILLWCGFLIYLLRFICVFFFIGVWSGIIYYVLYSVLNIFCRIH